MEMETLLIPISRKEFMDAKMGHILQKKFQHNDMKFCVIISNRFITENEATNLTGLGFDVLPLDISEILWSSVDSRHRTNVAEYENGVSLALVSPSVYNWLERDLMPREAGRG